MTTDTIKTLNNHVTIRKYTDQPLNDETMLMLLNAARRSPTSSNMQTYSFVVARDPETKKQLAVYAGNQRQVETCPVFVAICADVARLGLASKMFDKPFAQSLESTMVAVVDAAIVGMSLSLAAESIGLGTCMIGSMRNHPAEVAELLGLPDGVFVLYGLTLGWPAEHPPQKPRLPEEAIIHYERYDDGKFEQILHDYDAALARHYRDEGRETPDAAWTGVLAERFSTPQRPFLRVVLEKLGFSLD